MMLNAQLTFYRHGQITNLPSPLLISTCLVWPRFKWLGPISHLLQTKWGQMRRVEKSITHTHTQLFYGSVEFVRDNPGEPLPEETFTHSTLIVVINHPNLLSPSTMNHGILHIQSTCSAVFFHNLSPSFLWSTSWPGSLHFILHIFLHPIIVFFSQHMAIPSQHVSL